MINDVSGTSCPKMFSLGGLFPDILGPGAGRLVFGDSWCEGSEGPLQEGRMGLQPSTIFGTSPNLGVRFEWLSEHGSFVHLNFQ